MEWWTLKMNQKEHDAIGLALWLASNELERLRVKDQQLIDIVNEARHVVARSTVEEVE